MSQSATFNPVEIIRKKRDGNVLTSEEIGFFVSDYAQGKLPDYQAAALLMAIYFTGMSEGELLALTDAMLRSGEVINLSDVPGLKIDKHSTGGIGDKVSLHLAPAVAACGVRVPMISGRGLGHTGGTLDKLESIPGFSTRLSVPEFRTVLRRAGLALIGQTDTLVPADKALYALRDVTATVESIPLIAASIMSKKLAEGIDGLVLDVKVGSGAFLPGVDQARALARSLVDTANGAGCRTSALITDMDRPLAWNAGNGLEVREVMDTLTARAPSARLVDLTCALGGEVLALCGRTADAGQGAAMIRAALDNGGAAERFGRMVAAQGGPVDFVEHYARHLVAAPVIRDVPAKGAGIVARIDTRAVGEAVVQLGGGRLKGGDPVDPRVGFSALAEPGAMVGHGAILARVHAADETGAKAAIAALQAAYHLGDAPAPARLVQDRIA